MARAEIIKFIQVDGADGNPQNVLPPDEYSGCQAVVGLYVSSAVTGGGGDSGLLSATYGGEAMTIVEAGGWSAANRKLEWGICYLEEPALDGEKAFAWTDEFSSNSSCQIALCFLKGVRPGDMFLDTGKAGYYSDNGWVQLSCTADGPETLGLWHLHMIDLSLSATPVVTLLASDSSRRMGMIDGANLSSPFRCAVRMNDNKTDEARPAIILGCTFNKPLVPGLGAMILG